MKKDIQGDFQICISVPLIDFRKMKIFFWRAFSVFLSNAFCWNFIKFVNEKVNLPQPRKKYPHDLVQLPTKY